MIAAVYKIEQIRIRNHRDLRNRIFQHADCVIYDHNIISAQRRIRDHALCKSQSFPNDCLLRFRKFAQISGLDGIHEIAQTFVGVFHAFRLPDVNIAKVERSSAQRKRIAHTKRQYAVLICGHKTGNSFRFPSFNHDIITEDGICRRLRRTISLLFRQVVRIDVYGAGIVPVISEANLDTIGLPCIQLKFVVGVDLANFVADILRAILSVCIAICIILRCFVRCTTIMFRLSIFRVCAVGIACFETLRVQIVIYAPCFSGVGIRAIDLICDRVIKSELLTIRKRRRFMIAAVYEIGEIFHRDRCAC